MAELQVKVTSRPYSIITATQMSEVISRSVSEVNRMFVTLDSKSGQTRLDWCYPFPSKKNHRRGGMRFVVMNKKCLDYIRLCIITISKVYYVQIINENGLPSDPIKVKGARMTDFELVMYVYQMIVSNRD